MRNKGNLRHMADVMLAPTTDLKHTDASLQRVACYNCRTKNLLESPSKQWCRQCHAPLAPVPAWVRALGWPEKEVPSRERRRMHHRANVPVKAVKFDSDDGRSLAGALEIVARRDGVRMNALLLSLLRIGLEHRRANGSNCNGGVHGS